MIGNGDPVRIASEIPQDLYWPAEWGFGIDHPAPQMETAQEFGKLFGIRKERGWSGAAEFPLSTQALQAGEELAAEHLSKYRDGQKEIRLGRYQRLWPGAKPPAGTTQ